MSDTPRTDELSATVQNQNWGFRDMQLLAQNLERENTKLKEEIAGLTGGYVENGVALRHVHGDEFEKI